MNLNVSLSDINAIHYNRTVRVNWFHPPSASSSFIHFIFILTPHNPASAVRCPCCRKQHDPHSWCFKSLWFVLRGLFAKNPRGSTGLVFSDWLASWLAVALRTVHLPLLDSFYEWNSINSITIRHRFCENCLYSDMQLMRMQCVLLFKFHTTLCSLLQHLTSFAKHEARRRWWWMTWGYPCIWNWTPTTDWRRRCVRCCWSSSSLVCIRVALHRHPPWEHYLLSHKSPQQNATAAGCLSNRAMVLLNWPGQQTILEQSLTTTASQQSIEGLHSQCK